MIRSAAAIVLAAATLAAGLGSPAQAADWKLELSRQMFADHNCEVDFYSNVEESRQEGQQLLRARVHCHDQRRFDVERVGESGPFKVERCETEGSRSC